MQFRVKLKLGLALVSFLILLGLLSGGQQVQAADTGQFGLTTSKTFYTVDTGSGLVFKIRRESFGSSTQSPGDIASMVYNGVQYQDQQKDSQINSGFGSLYSGTSSSSVQVEAEKVGTDYIKITVKSGDLTHYYIAKRGQSNIYMATEFDSEPSLAMVRYIVGIPSSVLPNGPAPSNLHGKSKVVEAKDIFALPNGETRSKHYSNQRVIDWHSIGATGNNVGVWMIRDNMEGGSGGPFYRSLLNQDGGDQEITYIANYGMAQTESFRPGTLNQYTLAFRHDTTQPTSVDTSWMSDLGLKNYVGENQRGKVAGKVDNPNSKYDYTIGLSNDKAQYWGKVDQSGAYSIPKVIPGTYKLKAYKGELAVASQDNVTVSSGKTTTVSPITINDDPGSQAAIWRIGKWDGKPTEFLNGDKVTQMHPSDVRMANWKTSPYIVGQSTPASDFPAYEWKAVNAPVTVKFNLTKAQLKNNVARIGVTTTYANGRPQVGINGHNLAYPANINEPKTRSLTIGTYRGNNHTFQYRLPEKDVKVGENSLTISVVSGNSGTGFLSPGFSFDAADLVSSN